MVGRFSKARQRGCAIALSASAALFAASAIAQTPDAPTPAAEDVAEAAALLDAEIRSAAAQLEAGAITETEFQALVSAAVSTARMAGVPADSAAVVVEAAVASFSAEIATAAVSTAERVNAAISESAAVSDSENSDDGEVSAETDGDDEGAGVDDPSVPTGAVPPPELIDDPETTSGAGDSTSGK